VRQQPLPPPLDGEHCPCAGALDGDAVVAVLERGVDNGRAPHPPTPSPPIFAAGRLGGGSGFVISEDGIVVTNDHVFQGMAQAGAREVQAIFDDGRAYRIEPLAADAEADIAIGRILAPPGTRFKPLRIGRSGAMRRGDAVAVLGAPLGGSLVPAVGVLGGIRFVADDEIMSYVLNSRADWCLLQVDANMSSGSSGGPIVNADGEVVGVSVLVQTAGTNGVGNLNYGVAVDQAYPIIRQLLRDGRVTRAAIGMTIVHVDALQAQKELGDTGVPLLPPDGAYRTGLLVTYAVPGRPAAGAGVREGDVILEINGRKLTRKGDYFAALGPTYEEGKELVCRVWRPMGPAAGGRVGGGQYVTTTIRPVVRDAGAGGGGGGQAAGRGGRGRAGGWR
jgi:S1-C subfamily serine protease